MIALWILACTRTPPAPAVDAVVPPPVVEPSSLERLAEALALPAELQAAEVARLQAAASEAERLRLAVLLVLGDEAVRDPARARSLVDGGAFDGAAEQTVARLVAALADAHAERLVERTELQARIDELRRHAQELTERLEAIKDIEAAMQQGGADGQGEGPGR